MLDIILLVLLLAFLVLVIVTTPLRRLPGVPEARTDERLTSAAAEVENLEAERDAKYREIRDAELDRQTGHLSDPDFATIDADLRAQAIELLKRLDRARTRLERLSSDVEPEPAAAAEEPAAGAVADDGMADRYHRPRT